MSSRSIHFRIGDPESDQRLDRFLYSRVGNLSRMFLSRSILEGRCRVNQQAAVAGYKLCSDDLVEIEIDDDARTSMTPESIPIEIVFEDDQLIVVNKSSGLLVHPTKTAKSGTLANALVFHINRESLSAANRFDDSVLIRPGIVHRLDRATSGLIVVAKTHHALQRLTEHFRRRLVEKLYMAVVHGRIDNDDMMIDAPIARDADSRPQWRVMEKGKPAETRLHVVERGLETTLVQLTPLTGRTNQLRIHCAHIGHPIVGDNWYGSSNPIRLCLHASRLEFHHPTSNEWMSFESVLPDEFETVGDVQAAAQDGTFYG